MWVVNDECNFLCVTSTKPFRLHPLQRPSTTTTTMNFIARGQSIFSESSNHPRQCFSQRSREWGLRLFNQGKFDPDSRPTNRLATYATAISTWNLILEGINDVCRQQTERTGQVFYYLQRMRLALLSECAGWAGSHEKAEDHWLTLGRHEVKLPSSGEIQVKDQF